MLNDNSCEIEGVIRTSDLFFTLDVIHDNVPVILASSGDQLRQGKHGLQIPTSRDYLGVLPGMPPGNTIEVLPVMAFRSQQFCPHISERGRTRRAGSTKMGEIEGSTYINLKGLIFTQPCPRL